MCKIERIINRPVSSNCFVISIEKSSSCLVIDPGTEDCKELIDYLEEQMLQPEYIILTHEHVDHIIGCERLQKHYDVKIVCSSDCASSMQSSKFNLTRMTEQWEEKLSMPEADIALEDINYLLTWKGYDIQFFEAKGHSKGSIFFSLEDKLFIGDTLIKGYRTTTVLPGASKEDLLVTLKNILQKFDSSKTLVYSGHNDIFYLNEVVAEIKDQIDYLENKILRKTQKDHINT